MQNRASIRIFFRRVCLIFFLLLNFKFVCFPNPFLRTALIFFPSLFFHTYFFGGLSSLFFLGGAYFDRGLFSSSGERAMGKGQKGPPPLPTSRGRRGRLTCPWRRIRKWATIPLPPRRCQGDPREQGQQRQRGASTNFFYVYSSILRIEIRKAEIAEL